MRSGIHGILFIRFHSQQGH